MVKLYRIPGTGVRIRIKQFDNLTLKVEFDASKDYFLFPRDNRKEIDALGFPTKQPRPVKGGDLEEVTE